MAEVVSLSDYVSKRDRAALLDVLEAAQFVLAYKGYGRASFLASKKDQETVAGRLEAMSEAARHVSKKAREGQPRVQWEGLVELRAKVGDETWRADPLNLWNVVKTVVPRTVGALRPLVEQEEPKGAFLLEAPVPKPERAGAKRTPKRR